MKRVIYILLLVLAFAACEEIYLPDIDQMDNVLVIEAMLRADKEVNSIYLYKSRNFNNPDITYPRVGGATVFLIDNEGYTLNCPETTPGIYTLFGYLDPEKSYRLIIDLEGERYVSDMQMVPEKPRLDSVYADRAYQVSVDGTANSSDAIVKEYGVQVYSDMHQRNSLSHYRFYGRKVIQYLDTYDTVIEGMPETRPIYIWRSIYPKGIFNIAGPPEYSTEKSVFKHSLEFFENGYTKYMPDTMSFMGWVYIIDQFGINEDSYNYYKDLNQQLGAEGRIFDPVYIQLEGNITCETDPAKVVLGNFEITTYNEARYYLFYSNVLETFHLKKIEYFYDIPLRGYVKDIMPDFWEYLNKRYP